MTPDLMEAYASGMQDLEDALDALEQHGPAYLRTCLERGRNRNRSTPPCPRELPPPLGKVIREFADDALVRTLSRGGPA